MNDIVKFGAGGLPADPAALAESLATVSQNIQTGGTPYLRLLKSGVWAYGQENLEPEEGSEWAINPTSVQHGWACWAPGELLDEKMVPFNQQVPLRNTLPDLGQSWEPQMSVTMQCLNGEDTGVSVLYKGTSKGLLSAMKELINLLVAQLQTDPDHFVPVVTLDYDSYKHKTHGEIFTPILTIDRWISYEGEAGAAGAVEDQTDATDSENEANGEAATDSAQSEAKDVEPPPRRRRRAAAAQSDDGKASDKPDAKKPPAVARKKRRRRAS